MNTPLSFDDPTPAWAAACVYCHRDEWGLYDRDRHQCDHLPMTCTVCEETEPNRVLFELSHGITLGGSWEIDALLCVSPGLASKHVTRAPISEKLSLGGISAERDGSGLGQSGPLRPTT